MLLKKNINLSFILVLAMMIIPSASGMNYVGSFLNYCNPISFWNGIDRKNGILIGASLIVLPTICHAIWQNFNGDKRKANIKANIIDEARKNMPDDLKQCTTLKEIENLLNERTKNVFNELKNAFNISDQNWSKLNDEIKFYIFKLKFYLEEDLKPNSQCDDCFEREDIEKVYQVLKQNGIIPSFVSILNEDILEKSHKTGACTWSSISSTPHIFVCFSHKKQRIKNLKSICHEISHIIHHDNIISSLLLKTINKDYEIIKTNELYKKWNSAYELRADIFLLLKPENHAILQQYYDELFGYVSGLKNKQWQGIHEDGIHPNYEQTLMWLIKARDIINKSPQIKS